MQGSRHDRHEADACRYPDRHREGRGLGSIQDGSSLAYFLAGAKVRGGEAKPSRLEPACVILRPLEKLDVT
jgi:hypothetical protein